MLIIDKIILNSENGCEDMEPKNGLYRKNDVQVSVKEDGSVHIYSEKTAVNRIKIVFKNTFFDKARVLGDAFERAYGDLGWKTAEISSPMPWYFFAESSDAAFGFGVKTLPDAICTWYCGKDEIILEADIRNGTRPLALNGKELHACDIVTAGYECADHKSVHKFCMLMSGSARKVNRPIFGGNDWYCNYGSGSREKILGMTAKIVECSPKDSIYKPYMVIDDGWEICHRQKSSKCPEYNGGPWKMSNSFFGDMQSLAREIEVLGAIPGIWIRPLLTAEKTAGECILRENESGITLDPSSEKVLESVKEDMQRIRKWGYKLIKHDFSTFDIFGKWGNEIYDGTEYDICFHDKTKTTAQIIKNFYKAIREGAGEDTLIMGCNTVSHLSAGIFDIQRTGDDTSGTDWERTKKYGVNTLAFRMGQHDAFYLADADCVGITKEIPWRKNRKWLDVLAKSGTPLFVSIADDAYTDEVKKDISKAFENCVKASGVSYPSDWKTTPVPQIWKSCFGTDSYNWEE